ncbi:hypothetical protein ACB094_05G113000 [Castanea mollissima]
MASSDKSPNPMPSFGDHRPSGEPMTMGQQMIDKGAQILQSLKPVKQISQHACTFALYSHDMTRQIETHHFITRVNQDCIQCALFVPTPISFCTGVEYIVSDRIFEALPPEEQKLWHSHAYEIKSGLWVNPRVPGVIERPELENLAKTYGKFWCTWQVDRGDKLPLGAPALMMSPHAVNLGQLVHWRDNKYNISTEASRMEIAEPEWINPQANYWKQHRKGFAIDIKSTNMNLRVPFPLNLICMCV